MKILIIIALATTTITTLANAKKVKLEIYEIREKDNDRSDAEDLDVKNVINDLDDRDFSDERGDRDDADDELGDQLANIRFILQKQRKQDRKRDQNSLETSDVIKNLLKPQQRNRKVKPKSKSLKSDDSLVNLLKKLVNYLQSDNSRGSLDSLSAQPYGKYLDNSDHSYLDQTRVKSPILLLQDDDDEEDNVLTTLSSRDLAKLAKPKRHQLLPLSLLHSLDDDN